MVADGRRVAAIEHLETEVRPAVLALPVDAAAAVSQIVDDLALALSKA
jgi:hypothetical protein